MSSGSKAAAAGGSACFTVSDTAGRLRDPKAEVAQRRSADGGRSAMSVKPPDTVLDRPRVSFGPEIGGDLPSALRREWLVTNGLGGYAWGTVAGANTRRYHGLLVAALAPPVARTVLVGGLIDWGVYDGRRYPLATHEFGDGTVDPRGYRHLQAFALDGMLPVWTYALGDALLQKRVWMAHGANTTYVMYRLLRATRTVELEITPLVTYRDFHTLTSGRGWRPAVTAEPRGVEIRAFEGAAPVRLVAETGRFAAHGEWYWNFLHREESARGLDDRSDLFAPGVFTASLSPGGHLALVATSEAGPPAADPRPLAAAQARQAQLLQRAGARDSHPAVQQLVLAARATYEATRDDRLVDELLPVVREMVDRYERGTRHGIGMDPADGLLRQGAPGLALTWMDAKIGGGVVTPRAGKAVEINALWYNALRTLAVLLAARDEPAAH